MNVPGVSDVDGASEDVAMARCMGYLQTRDFFFLEVRLFLQTFWWRRRGGNCNR